MSPSARTRILLVLHAHIPYVRIPEERFPLQELWLYQAMLDCYIPILRMIENLSRDGIPARLALSVSPTLLSMLNDEYYVVRFLDYLSVLGELCAVAAAGGEGEARRPAEYLSASAGEARVWMAGQEGGIVGAIAASPGRGADLITTSATHAYLPAWRHSPGLVRLQVEAGLRCFEKIAGFRPDGFWIPEMGYFSGLDRVLTDAGVRYTFLSAHSLYTTPSVPPSGNFFPAVTGSGLRVFARDAGLSDRIWSREIGYPGDSRYREFHQDFSYALPADERTARGVPLAPFGLRLHRITGAGMEKEFYDPNPALGVCREHVDHFLGAIRERAVHVRELTGIDPVFTLPFDMELFGHWWHEGPRFIEGFIRAVNEAPDLELVSPRAFLDGDGLPVVVPAESSWGRGGYGGTWLNPEVMDIYARVAALYGRLEAMPHNGDAAPLWAALREILLAQSSDWPFGVSQDNFRAYFLGRIGEHMEAAEKIIGQMESSSVDTEYVDARSGRYVLCNAISGDMAALFRARDA